MEDYILYAPGLVMSEWFYSVVHNPEMIVKHDQSREKFLDGHEDYVESP